MYLREHRYLKDKIVANAGTFDEELPEKGVLTAIRLQLYMANANGIHNNNRARIIDRITSLEVNNGSDKAAYSVRGQQAKVINFLDYKQVMYEKAILYGNHTQRTDIVIPFGRYIGDPAFGLDLSEYDEVWIEHINDLTTAQCATNALKTNVNLIYMEDLPSAPTEYLKNYEWRDKKPAADGQELRFKLPTRNLIKRVFVQLDPDLATAGSVTNDPKSDSMEIGFTFKDGEETIFDHRPRDIARFNALQYGLVETQGRYFQSASQYFDVGVMDVINLQNAEMGTAMTGTAIHSVMEESNDRFMKLSNIASGTTVPYLVDVRAVGAGYYHSLVLFDAMKGEMRDFLNPAVTGDAKGTVEIYNSGYKDDHTMRAVLCVPVSNGSF